MIKGSLSHQCWCKSTRSSPRIYCRMKHRSIGLARNSLTSHCRHLPWTSFIPKNVKIQNSFVQGIGFSQLLSEGGLFSTRRIPFQWRIPGIGEKRRLKEASWLRGKSGSVLPGNTWNMKVIWGSFWHIICWSFDLLNVNICTILFVTLPL